MPLVEQSVGGDGAWALLASKTRRVARAIPLGRQQCAGIWKGTVPIFVLTKMGLSPWCLGFIEGRFMPELELSQAAQHWAIVVLVWIGFGSLAGLLARVVLPVREPSRPLPTLAVGIAGSALGLAVLSCMLGDRPLNPVSPLGFLAAAAGAAVLLVLYQIIQSARHKPDPDQDITATTPTEAPAKPQTCCGIKA